MAKTIHYCENRLQAYQRYRFLHGCTAAEAWRLSAEWPKVPRWFGDGSFRPRYRGGLRGGRPFESGSSTLTWCECPGIYLKCMGTYSEHDRGNHKCWYLNHEFQDEVVEGIVYRMRVPRHMAIDGVRIVYLAGIMDPYNEGPAMLQLSAKDQHSNLDDAFRDADQTAEHYAERECEYQTAYLAGSRVGEARVKIRKIRKRIKKLIAEIKAHRPAGWNTPTVCKTLRSSVRTYKAKLNRLLKKVDELSSEYSGDPNGWRKHMIEGFRNGVSDYTPRTVS